MAGEDGDGPTLEPEPGAGLLVVEDAERILVVGDLHLGLEDELKQKGFTVPSQTDELARTVADAARGREVDRIVLIGDVKHNIPYTTFDERRELGRFFEALLDAVDRVDIARGNHDAGLEEDLPDGVGLRDARGFVLGRVGFLHGHTWPDPDVAAAEVIVIGHVHPAVAFTDHQGARQKEACWLRMQVTDRYRERYDGAEPLVVVLPAANPLLGGTAVNEETPPGPLFGNGAVDLDGARVTTLDGIDLGRLADVT